MKHFLFYKYCSTYTLKFFPADKTGSPLVFANVYIYKSSNYLRVFIELTEKNHRESHSDAPTDHFIRTVQTERR